MRRRRRRRDSHSLGRGEPRPLLALRGGGGNFGIVSSFTFRLNPLGPVVAFARVFYPVEDAAAVLRAYREYFVDAPDEVTSEADAITLPADPDLPADPRAAVLARRRRRRLEQLPGVTAVIDTAALKALFDKYLGLFYAFVSIMLAFAAALAFAIMFTTTSANLAERAIEVTTLRASGVAHRTLTRLLRAENLLLTIAGIVAGLPVAYLIA